jgi:hypothetical protein
VGDGVPPPRTVKAQAHHNTSAAPAAHNGTASQRNIPNEKRAVSVFTSQMGIAPTRRPGTSSIKRVVLRAVIANLHSGLARDGFCDTFQNLERKFLIWKIQTEI